jgi:glucoside 3-dehydrogenase (cytochrome c) hitch-hiker subunit
MTKRAVSRRTALKTIGVGTGAVALLPWLSEEGLAAFAEIQKTAAPPSLKALSASQYATLETLVEAIIPADERSPGAKEARVADYIDLLLSEADEERRAQWLDGLRVLDAEAAARYAAPFVNLSASQVDELLTEASRHEKAPEPSKTERRPLQAFFVTAKEATIHGYYTSEIGIHKELRYKGNKVLLEYVGCQTVDGKDCPWCGQTAEA